jgi:hypothetical protein
MFNFNRFNPFQWNAYDNNQRAPFQAAQNNNINFAQQIAAMCAGIPDGRIQNEARKLIRDLEERERNARVPNRGVHIEEIVDQPAPNRQARVQRQPNISAPRREIPHNQRNNLRATAEEIECNLAILKQSISEGKASVIDREFIKILQEDLKALKSHPSVTREQITNLRKIHQECAGELFAAQERR